MFGLIAILALFFVLVKLAIAVLAFVFWLWMLVHAITNTGLATGEKIAWVLVIIFLPFLGALLYCFIGRPKGIGAV